jgi:hypothetical protein
MLDDDDRDWDRRNILRGWVNLPIVSVVTLLFDKKWEMIRGSAGEFAEGDSRY